MRTTVELSDDLYKKVSKAYKIKSKSTLVNMGLEELYRKKEIEEFIRLSGKLKLKLNEKDIESARGR